MFFLFFIFYVGTPGPAQKGAEEKARPGLQGRERGHARPKGAEGKDRLQKERRAFFFFRSFSLPFFILSRFSFFLFIFPFLT